jgi:NADPH:quinone reductase-like Zn-dependent oxidoreductase
MKAIVYTEYGPPDVLQLKEVAEPVPEDDEVLVQVHAASVNAIDRRSLRGAPFFYRFEIGLLKPKHTILGADIAGRVQAVGCSVAQFQPGDDVFGEISESGFGGFAEFVSVPEGALVLKPASITFEDAAAAPVAAITALQGLRDHGQIRPGQKVLINGASGGVGTFAVQIAKSFGTEVTGVCSTSKLETTLSIGADHVIDYTREDFTQSGQHYDLIFDVVANRPASDLKRALSPNGIAVVAGFTTVSHMVFQVMFLGSWMSRTGSRKIGTMGSAVPKQEDLLFLRELLEAGKIVPVIDRRYPLSETAEAIRYLEEGHVRGKLIITMEPDH